MRIAPPPPSCTQFLATELPCPTCGMTMKLTLIEPRGARTELHTFECMACDSGNSFLMAV